MKFSTHCACQLCYISFRETWDLSDPSRLSLHVTGSHNALIIPSYIFNCTMEIFIAAQVCLTLCRKVQLPSRATYLSTCLFSCPCQGMRFKLYNTFVLLCVRRGMSLQFNVCLLVYFYALIPSPHTHTHTHEEGQRQHRRTGNGIAIESRICPVCEVKVPNKYTMRSKYFPACSRCCCQLKG